MGGIPFSNKTRKNGQQRGIGGIDAEDGRIRNDEVMETRICGFAGLPALRVCQLCGTAGLAGGRFVDFANLGPRYYFETGQRRRASEMSSNAGAKQA